MGDANSGAEGQLPDQRPAATQEHGGVYEGPTAASHNKQVYYFILFIYWLVLKSGLLAIRVPEIFLISEPKPPKQIKKKLFFLEVGKS